VGNRAIPLEGAMNFRDFGGYATAEGRRVKTHRLFRSGGLAGLTDADHAVLGAFDIKLICDLRRGSEKSHMPTRWCTEPAAELWHLPLFPDGSTSTLAGWSKIKTTEGVRDKMIDIYRALVTKPDIFEKYRILFERLAQADNYPVLVHCSAGKDRTGVVCALILSMLGVDRDTIMEDYLLTRHHYDSDHAWERLSTQVLDFSTENGWTKELLAPVFGVEEAYLNTSFGVIDKEYGTVDAFLADAVGLKPETIDALKVHLLD